MRPSAGSLWPTLANYLENRGHLVILAVLVALSLFLRIYGIHWDQGGLFHPDERAILFHVEAISFPTSDLSSLFSEDSPLNPAWFPYGSLPLYLLKLVGFLGPPFFENPGLEGLAIMGRAMSAVFDVVTILIVYKLGRRLFNRWAGLIGAALIGLSALHIQQSHFFVTDIMLVTWLVTCFLFLSRAMDDGRTRNFLFAGLFFGLALATKTSAAPLIVVFIVAALLFWRNDGDEPQFRRRRTHQAIWGLFVAAITTLVTFLITQPYAFIDWATFWGDVGEQARMVRRDVDFPYTRQYIGTVPYLYPVHQLVVWGMGLPAGILFCLGLVFSVWVALFRRNSKHALLLSWVIPYFLVTGAFDVKFMRYMLPITPFLAIMAGSLISWILKKARDHRNTLVPTIAFGGLSLVITATAFYALSYANIYSKPHTATAASEWINTHVPKTATLLQDSGWEEGFKDLAGYTQFRMEVYDDETPAKRYQMIESLTRADYLLFYSNRQYGAIPRLTQRYPMTRQYYNLLFSGELGYQLVHWESSYPNLYGFSLIDDTFGRPNLQNPLSLQGHRRTISGLNLGYADESFTVYDHPLVLIFKKTLTGSQEEQEAMLDGLLPDPRGSAGTSHIETPLMMSSTTAEIQQKGGTWSHIFDRNSLINDLPALAWYLFIQVLFLITLPIAFLVFRRLPDRGYLLGKILGILLVSYIAWLFASLHWISFSRLSIGVGLAIIALCSLAILRFKHLEIRRFLHNQRKMILTGEALFLISFLGFYAIRLWNPDLWHPFRGGEKPMDFAYFNAIVRSSYMPPYDPWFSGGYLNYYYFGHFMNSVITKFLGIVPSTAINLVVPLFFALTTTAAFSLIYNLSTLFKRRIGNSNLAIGKWVPDPLWAGLVAATLVAIAGNLDGIVQLSQGIGRIFSGEQFGAFDFWRSSRMMPPDPPGFEITEFPFFTFLFADPHAHLFVIPLTLLALGLSMSLLLGAGTRFRNIVRLPIPPFLALGLTLGAILATNSWDVLTYALIASMAVVVGEYLFRKKADLSWVVSSAIRITVLGGLTALFFLPYIKNYQMPIREGAGSLLSFIPLFGSVASTLDNTFKSSETVTSIHHYMAIHGLFMLILFSSIALKLWRQYDSWHTSNRSNSTTLGIRFNQRIALLLHAFGWRWLCYLALGAGTVWVLGATGKSTLSFIFGLLFLSGPLIWRELSTKDRGTAISLLAYALIVTPLLLGIFVDVFTFEGDIARLNTVFKFYLQGWVLFGLASAYALWEMRFGEDIPWKKVRRLWQGLIVLLVAAALIYPAAATPVRARDRFEALPPSPDGMAFMDTAVYFDQDTSLDLRHDKDAILWLQDNVQGSPVFVEGLTPLYRWGNRISVYTGLPAVIGWDHHQKQQRGDYAGRNSGVDRRRWEVDQFYRTVDPKEAISFISRYNVRYIYIGQLERTYYPPEGIAKFDSMVGKDLEVAYNNQQVRIYRVIDQSVS